MNQLQLRRQARQRREFLYKRELETRERNIWQRKQAVKDALASGKLGKGKKSLKGVNEASETDPGLSLELDDEYAQAGIDDPKILITTSRSPSSKLSQFAKVRCFSLLWFERYKVASNTGN